MNKETDYCFVMPILPDKVDEARNFWKEANTGELDKYMRAIGQSRVAEFLQTLPEGKFLVTYVKEAADLGTTFGKNREQGSEIAAYVREGFLRFTGIDFTEPKNTPKVEKIRAWEDAEPKEPARRCSAFAVPILPRKTKDVKHFFEVINNEMAGQEDPVFRYQTVSKIGSFLQYRPEGDYLVEYVESREPIGTVMRMGLSTGTPISEFIRKGFLGFSALPLPLAPDIELLLDWSASRGYQSPAARAAPA